MRIQPDSPAQPTLITDIYNYCNSWCERCLFTARCRSYQLQQANGMITPPDPNASLIEQLTEALQLTANYMASIEQAKLASHNLPAPAEQQTLEEATLKRHHLAKEHPAARLATTYLTQSGNWLASERRLLEDAGHQQLERVRMGFCTEDEAMILLNALKDAHEQIRWYRTLIPVKTKAALRMVDELSEDANLTNYYTGKAKLVLVSINQSLLAWQTVLAYYPEQLDDLLDLLATLSRLRQQIDLVFPAARTFRRPGLD